MAEYVVKDIEYSKVYSYYYNAESTWGGGVVLGNLILLAGWGGRIFLTETLVVYIRNALYRSDSVIGYTKNHAVKNSPITSSVTAR